MMICECGRDIEQNDFGVWIHLDGSSPDHYARPGTEDGKFKQCARITTESDWIVQADAQFDQIKKQHERLEKARAAQLDKAREDVK